MIVRQQPIPLDAVVETDAYKEADSGLVVPIGVAQEGLVLEDFADCGGMLLAGATGSGKSHLSII